MAEGGSQTTPKTTPYFLLNVLTRMLSIAMAIGMFQHNNIQK
jgi:hypothetical protein